MTTSTPPGWYPNPDGSGSQRYWDGQAWQQVAAVATPQKPKPKGSGLKVLGVIAAAVVGLAIGGSLLRDGEPEKSADQIASEERQANFAAQIENTQREHATEDANAQLQCEEMVTKQASSPSTANFPDKHTIRYLANGARQVRGVVDAQNKFGATVRADFVCTSTPNGDGTYQVVVNELNEK